MATATAVPGTPTPKRFKWYITWPLAAGLLGFIAVLATWVSGVAALTILVPLLAFLLVATGAGFVERRWGAGAKKWFVRVVVAAAVICFGGLVLAVIRGQFPLTAKLAPLFKKGVDNKMASRAPVAPTAKGTLLRDQVMREEAGAYMIQRLLERGERGEAEKLMDALIDNGVHIRAITGSWGKFETKPQAKALPTSVEKVAGGYSPTTTGKVQRISLAPGEVYDIDKVRGEQRWQYISFNGTFDHRVDKGDGRACWKLVDNNRPWKADADGKLQVRAGNSPVTLTVNVL